MNSITVDEIRAKFPNPIKCDARKQLLDDGEYCVGGAFCTFVGYWRLAFPRPEVLGGKLQLENPALSSDTAFNYSVRITESNDAEDFELAWRILGEALNYGR